MSAEIDAVLGVDPTTPATKVRIRPDAAASRATECFSIRVPLSEAGRGIGSTRGPSNAG